MRFTSNLPGDLYTPAECVEQIEYFTQQIKKKFNSEYGPDIHNERLKVLEFLYLVEKFLANISKNSFITTAKVKAAEMTAVKKKMQKILQSKKLYFLLFFKAK